MLTEHQNTVLNNSILSLQKENFLIIKGSAGVGKTFLVDYLIKNRYSFLSTNSLKNTLCTAPTHKAVAVLREKIKSSSVKFATTHSALLLRREINNKTGEVTFEPSKSGKKEPLEDVNLLIVDEASMLNSNLLILIENYARIFGVKVVFLGDEKQLPPVGEEVSPVFTRDFPEVELTEIVRQQEGNPIIHLSRNLKNVNKIEENLIVDNDNFIGYTFSNDLNKVVKSLAIANGSSDIKYLAYTNKEVDRINFLVRQKIYNNPRKIEKGETLIFNSPYGEEYYTNEEIKVNSLAVITKKFSVPVNTLSSEKIYDTVELKIYSINSIKVAGENVVVLIAIHEDSEKELKNLEATLKLRARISEIGWVDYYAFIEQFADLKYNHAITVHKSQGSTFKKTILNLKNIKINKNIGERDKLLYTGITRASDLLILYNF